MIKKIFHLFRALLNNDLIIDYYTLGLGRKRNFKIPRISNYIRISNFELAVNEIYENNIVGNVAEVGVYKGEFAKYINSAFPDRTLYLFDTFSGFSDADISVEKRNNFSKGNQDFSDTSVNTVLQKMKFPTKCIVKKGYFPESLEGLEDSFCFVSLDPDLYKPILDGLEYFYPRLVKGGYIFIHDYNNSLYPGAKQAVREFCKKYNISFVPITDSWGTAIITK